MAERTKLYTDVRGGINDPTFHMTLPGGGGSLKSIGGLEGILVSLGGVGQQISNLTNEIRIQNHQQAQMFGFSPTTGSVSFDGVAAEILSGRQVSGGSANVKDPIHDGVPGKPDSSGITDPIQDRALEFQRQRQSIGYELPDSYKVGTIRQQVGSYAQKQLMNRNPWGDQYTLDAKGKWHDPQGRFVKNQAEDPGVAGYMQRQSVMMAGRGAAQTLAEGGTLREAGATALGSSVGGVAALRMAGGVGLAIGAIDKTGDFFESQRASNAEWQSIMGGTNLGATKERFDQKMFGYSQFGVLDSDEAEALYRGVAEAGLRGDARDTAQNFAMSNYKQFGMGIDDSIKIIETAARTGQSSLLGVSAALERVTETAVEAGVNADKMRTSWTNAWAAASNSMASGTSVVTASAVTESFAGLGPGYENATISFNTNLKRRIGNTLGMSESALAIYQSLPGNESVMVEGLQRVLSEDLLPQIGNKAQGVLQQLAGGRKASDISAGDRLTMSNAFLAAGGNPTVAKDILSMNGVDGLNDNQSVEFAALLLAGAYNPKRDAASAVAALEDEQSRGIGGLTEEKWRGGRRDAAISGGRGSEVNDELTELTKKVFDSKASGWEGLWDYSDDRITRNFMNQYLETGQRGGIPEKLATDRGARRQAQKVTVLDKDGNSKTVGLDTAMSSYYEQLEDGSAIVAEGDAQGQTLKDVFSELSTGTQNIRGTITVGITSEAKRWLTTNNLVDDLAFTPSSNPETRPGG